MPISEAYRRQVVLLMRLLPLVAAEKSFALKGGTAINLFVRDMPRLSVDIDLMYLPVASRDTSLAAIHAAFQRIREAVLSTIPRSKVTETLVEGAIVKLLVRADEAQVKIELSPVMRGVVYEPQVRSVVAAVEELFGFAEMQVVSFADLYAGKLMAALDRQHPRDLFDVRDLLANEGITDELREAFIVYLISHNRPMGEVLSGRRKDLTDEYRTGFAGMTEGDVALDELLQAQDTLIATLIGAMPQRHKDFLVGFERGAPDWSLLAIPHASELPAVLWRQRNLDSLAAEKRAALVEHLKSVLL